MNELQLKLCDIQGRLFELSAEKKYDSATFIKAFMMPDTAKEMGAALVFGSTLFLKPSFTYR